MLMTQLNLGEQIKRYRIERGMSQEDAARAAGVSQGAWSLIEKGKREPVISTLQKIAAALGVKVSELIGEE